MPCRATRCHRAAARLLRQPSCSSNSSSHIWISDDLLAQAFSRFTIGLGPATTTTTTTTTCRRHASNVPGPLEARKRAAKRRMVGLAHHAGPGMPMADFGSLFGTGPLDLTSLDLTSLWKPPTASHKATLLSESPCQVLQPRSVKQKSPINYTLALKDCRSLDAIADLHAALHPDGHVPLRFSKAAFRRLLDIALVQSKPSGLNDDILQDIVYFLQCDLNHDDARNLVSYAQWLNHRTRPISALLGLANVLSDKMLLTNISFEEVHAVINHLQPSSHPIPPQSDQYHLILRTYTTVCRAVLDKLPSYTLDQRSTILTALIQPLCALAPSPRAAHLIQQASSALAPHQQSRVLPPLIGRYLSAWLHSLSCHDLCSAPLLHMLKTLESGLTSRCADNIVINATAQCIAQSLRSDPTDTSLINHWLCLLRQSNTFHHRAWDSSVWAHIYSALAKRFSLADLDPHFDALGSVCSARVVLRHWAPRLVRDHLDMPRIKAPTTSSQHHTKLTASYTVSHSAASLGKLKRTQLLTTAKITASKAPPENIFESVEASFEARLANYSTACTPITAPYANLVASMHQHGLRYEHVLHQVIDFLQIHHSPRQILGLTFTLMRQSVYVPPALALPLIHFMIDTGNVGYALRIFQACGNVWPSLCPELIFALIESGPVHTSALFAILNRPEYSNSLPVGLRSKPTNNLSEQRVRLIHNMAYALSKSPHMTSRQAFRSVHDCVAYLRDRNAPLSSLVSRALVQAAVLRPLQEGRWVSTVKFAWVLEFVRDYEGDEVADVLDKIAFEWRSSNYDKDPLYGDKHRHDAMKSLTMMLPPLRQQQYRGNHRHVGRHSSLRWKRRTGPWKPWLTERKNQERSSPSPSH